MIDLKSLSPSTRLAVLVAALGYFVDAFDMLLFSIVRVNSLRDLGVSEQELLSVGKFLFDCQMWGLLLGGLLWGVLGDKVGRIQVLFGSIFLYSVATMLNGLVTTTDQYALLRFFAGLGLAGELGGGITLVSELLPKKSRGIGTTFVATVGVSGVVAAGLIGKYIPSWRNIYYLGGALGFALLFLRLKVNESGIFSTIKKDATIRKGDLLMLFGSFDRLKRYFSCVVIATPTWYLVGVLMTFCSEIGAAMGISEPLLAADAILWTYVGLTAGDLSSGLFSQYLKSRKRAIYVFLFSEMVFVFLVHWVHLTKPWHFYAFCFPLGFFVGYWVLFITTAAEQFGTNLRATVATTVPNFVRASTIPLTSSFIALKGMGYAVVDSSLLVGLFTLAVAFFGATMLRESFDLDLDYLETHKITK